MQPITALPVLRRSRWRRWLSCTFLALSATGAMADDNATVRQVQTSYRVIPLSSAQGIFGIDINARGQVVFTEVVDDLRRRAMFYDGHAVRDLGSLGGGSATAAAVNDFGQVAGSATLTPGATLTHAYRWSAQTGMVDLTGPRRGESTGNDINNKGEVTGGVVFEPAQDTNRRAFIWRPQTGLADIGTIDTSAYGQLINDAGTVAGMTGGNSLNVFRWTRQDGLQALTRFYSDFNTVSDMNASGHVVGTAAGENPSQPPHAFLWTPREGLVDLGEGIPNRTLAVKINSKDMVILNVRDFVEFPHGYVWTRETGRTEIGAGRPGIVTLALGLNNLGQVVGTFDGRAFVWTRAQGVIDLNTRLVGAPEGLVLSTGHAISDNGSIVAAGNTGLVLLVPTAGSGHAAPVVGPIQVAGRPRAQALLSFSAAFKDADLRDTHKATWTWGDGGTDNATVNERNGSGNTSGQHTYRSPGSYTVTLSVTDSSGRRTAVQRTVAVRGPAPSADAGD